MSDLFQQARDIEKKLTKSQEDWKEIVRLYLAAAEKRSGLSAIEIADCYQWSGNIILNHYEDKSAKTYNEGLRLFMILERMQGLPNWYQVVDQQLLARIAPSSFGFDPSQIIVGDGKLIDSLSMKMVRMRGPLETAACLPYLLIKSIIEPVNSRSAGSCSENTTAIKSIDKIISMVWEDLPRIPIGEAGLTCKGFLHHHCMPKTRAAFNAAKQSYKAAIKKITLIENGACCAYAHLIDLLERPEAHGFGGCVGVDAASLDMEAQQLREQRDQWYRTDLSRRLMFWEMQLLLNKDFDRGIIGLQNPVPEFLERGRDRPGGV